MFRFGSAVMLSSLLQQFSTNIASLITARFVDLDAMGLFSRGQSVTGLFGRLIMDGVRTAPPPGAGDAAPERPGRRPHRLAILDYLAVVTWPFFLFLALYARRSWSSCSASGGPARWSCSG